MCRLPQGLKNSSSIFQNYIESNLKRIKGVVIFQDDVLVDGTTKDQYEKRMLAVKSRLREKTFTINEKKSNSKPVSSRYSLTKETTVTTDASEKTIGGVLSQEGHPVIYVSRKLSQAEENYSNIEREALAIVFVVTRLKQFLLRRRFILQTDHKPLKYLFAPDKEIPKTASARISRCAIALMGFDFELKYKPGEQIPHADALSRLDFDDDSDQVCFALDNIYFVQTW